MIHQPTSNIKQEISESDGGVDLKKAVFLYTILKALTVWRLGKNEKRRQFTRWETDKIYTHNLPLSIPQIKDQEQRGTSS